MTQEERQSLLEWVVQTENSKVEKTLTSVEAFALIKKALGRITDLEGEVALLRSQVSRPLSMHPGLGEPIPCGNGTTLDNVGPVIK